MVGVPEPYVFVYTPRGDPQARVQGPISFNSVTPPQVARTGVVDAVVMMHAMMG